MVLKRLLVVVPMVAPSACFLIGGDFPTTWKGRYEKAMEELQDAKSEDHRFYALNDAAKSGLCAKFWDLERGRLERWTVLARGGVMPDFGANLLY